MSDKNLKEEIKQVVTNLGNIEFTVEDELKFCKEVLKRTEKEYDQLKVENEILIKDKANLDVITETLKAQFNQLKTENDSLKSELMQTYCYLDADKETIDQLKKENVKLKELVKTRIEDLCDSCGASSMIPMPCKVYEQILQEIIKIAEEQQSWNECNMRYSETESEDDIFAYNWSALNQILQKCEVLKDE